MSRVVYPDEGLQGLLARQLGTGVGEIDFGSSSLCLFTNNITPDRDTILATLTEPGFGGYAPITWNTLTVSSSGIAAHVAFVVYDQVIFTLTSGGPDTCYGWFVKSASGKLLAISRFDNGPYTVAVAGQTIRFTPTMRNDSTETTSP